LLTQILFGILGSLRALPLKILSGALPLNPTTFEKVDKTFNCHSYTMRKSFNRTDGQIVVLWYHQQHKKEGDK